MRKSFLASAVIGLARRPLDDKTVLAANQLVEASSSPAQKALALAASEFLAAQTNLDTIQAVESRKPLIPAYSLTPFLSRLVDAYLKLTAGLLDLPEIKLPLSLGIHLPPQSTVWYLETAFRVYPKDPHYYTFLGKRGRWLASQHPKFKDKTAFLENSKLPDLSKKPSLNNSIRREAFVLYHLYLSEDLESRKIIEELISESSFNKADKATLLSAFRQNLLHQFIEPYQLTKKLLASKASLETWEKMRLRIALKEPEAIEYLATQPNFSSSVDFNTLDAKQFEILARAELCRHDLSDNAEGNREILANLAKGALASTNSILESHPILPVLLSQLNATVCASMLDLAGADQPCTLKENQRQAFLAASEHPFSTDTTLTLLEEASTDRRQPSHIPAVQLMAKLNWNALEEIEGSLRDSTSPVVLTLIAILRVKAQLLKGISQVS